MNGKKTVWKFGKFGYGLNKVEDIPNVVCVSTQYPISQGMFRLSKDNILVAERSLQSMITSIC